MNPEIQAEMNNLCHQMTEVQKKLRVDPSPDAQFCSRLVGTAIATVDMRIGEQWGLRFKPEPFPEVEPIYSFDSFVKAPATVRVEIMTKSEAPAAPKAKSKEKNKK